MSSKSLVTKRKIQFRFNPKKDIDLLHTSLACRPWGPDMWKDVALKMRNEFQYDVTERTCRLRVQFLIEQFKTHNMSYLNKRGTDEENNQREALIQEMLVEMGDQSIVLDYQSSSPEAEDNQADDNRTEDNEVKYAVPQDVSPDFLTLSCDMEDVEEMDSIPPISCVMAGVVQVPTRVSESRKRCRNQTENYTTDADRENMNTTFANEINKPSGSKKQKLNSYFLEEMLKIEKEKANHMKIKDLKELEIEEKKIDLEAKKIQMETQKRASETEIELRKIQLEQDRMKQHDSMMTMMSSIMQMLERFANNNK